tara:strand:+ start:4899 stop:5681 length:783 start_codon:yes stop_codon:yes gene_type:complete
MQRYFAQVEYDGSKYCGFQKQTGTKKTIQHFLEKSFSKVANHRIHVTCAGRTDSGVHAISQIVHFDTKSKRKEDSWIKGANTFLPEDIVIKGIFAVRNNYHARFDAINRSYTYVIKNSLTPAAIGANNCLWIRSDLNHEKMHKAAQKLVGEKDFSAFRASSCQSKSPVREIFSTSIFKKGEFIFFRIKGNAFMLNMVRIIMGTLIKVGRGELTIKEFGDIIKSCDRKRAGKTISPHGLYFVGPEYNELEYNKKDLVDELD